MSAQSTPTGPTSHSDRIPTSAELDRFIQQLEQRDRELSDSLARHTAPKRAKTVSFDRTGDSPYTSRRTQQFQRQVPRGQYDSSSDEEQHHQPMGDGARQANPPQLVL